MDDFKWVTIREMELRQEVKPFGQVEGKDLGLLEVDFHFVVPGE